MTSRTESTVTTTEELHLDLDEIEDAVKFMLDEMRVIHLVKCGGCQSSVEWQRKATLGQLWDEENDWACKVFEALARRCQDQGKAMVYAVRAGGRYNFSILAAFPFQISRIIKISGYGR